MPDPAPPLPLKPFLLLFLPVRQTNPDWPPSPPSPVTRPAGNALPAPSTSLALPPLPPPPPSSSPAVLRDVLANMLDALWRRPVLPALSSLLVRCGASASPAVLAGIVIVDGVGGRGRGRRRRRRRAQSAQRRLAQSVPAVHTIRRKCENVWGMYRIYHRINAYGINFIRVKKKKKKKKKKKVHPLCRGRDVLEGWISLDLTCAFIITAILPHSLNAMLPHLGG